MSPERCACRSPIRPFRSSSFGSTTAWSSVQTSMWPGSSVMLDRASLETLVQRLAERLDDTAPEARERLLVKAFMLLAERHGDLDLAIGSLDDAAKCGRRHE